MSPFSTPVLLASALLVVASCPVNAQTPSPAAPPAAAQPQDPAPPPPKPYKAIAVTIPTPPADPSFEAFRKRLGEVAQKMDRAALARLVVGKDYFWESDTGNRADKKKSALDNLGAAIGGFGGPDTTGWETLEAAAAEPSVEPYGAKKNVMCAPASPQFDVPAFEATAKDTGTDVDEWAFPTTDGIDVRAAGKPDAPVIDKLGMALVRVLPDAPATTDITDDAPLFLRVVTPAGRIGFVPANSMAALVSDQICYVKNADGWKITGFLGGD